MSHDLSKVKLSAFTLAGWVLLLVAIVVPAASAYAWDIWTGSEWFTGLGGPWIVLLVCLALFAGGAKILKLLGVSILKEEKKKTPHSE